MESFSKPLDLLIRLNEMRSVGELCDATLQSAEGVRFPVHRNVLAAASPFFRAMFCSGFQESLRHGDTPINLPDVCSTSLGVVLNCIYTNELDLCNETVSDVTAVAHMWCLEGIVKSCAEYMVKNLSNETCFQSLKLAETFAIGDLAKAADTYILGHFVTLKNQEDFLEMEVEKLRRFLGDDALVGQESQVLRGAQSWLEHHPCRVKYVGKIMGLIRFHSMTADQLVDEATKNDLIRKNSSCLDMVLKAVKYTANELAQPLAEDVNPRGITKVVIIEDGESGEKGYSTGTNGKMYIYNMSHIFTDVHAPLSCDVHQLDVAFIVSSLNLVTVGNFIYLFGVDNSYTNVARRFAGSRQAWISIAPVPRPAAVATVMGRTKRHILSVGGMFVTKESKQVRHGAKLDSSVYRYSLRKNAWKKRMAFPDRVAFAMSCCYLGTLFVAGGVVPACNQPLFRTRKATASVYTWNRVYAYDSSADLWFRRASMYHARSEAVFEAVGAKLYLLGGCRDEEDEPVPAIEMYDTQTNQWSLVEKLPGFPYDEAASFVCDNEIFLLGGYNYEKDLASDNIVSFSPSSEHNDRRLSVLKPKLRNVTCQHVCTLLKMAP